MFPVLLFLISLAGLSFASYTDLKERLIPNKLTYSMIVLGVILQFAYSAITGNFWIFATAIATMVAGFVGAYILWRLGVWAGGDVKLFTALCCLNPINYVILGDIVGLGTAAAANGINAAIFSSFDYSLPIFPLSLFMFSIFSMLPYGVIISINGVAKNIAIRHELFSEVKKISVRLMEVMLAAVGINAVLVAIGLGNHSWLVLPTLIVLALLNFWVRTAIIAIVFAFAFLQNPWETFSAFALLFTPVFFIYLLVKLYFVSRDRILEKEIKISEMEEGMISGETIVVQKGILRRMEALKIGKIINYLRNNNLEALLALINPKGTLLANAKSAAGITVEQLRDLKKAVVEKRIEDRIKIKLSAPFVPAMFLAYLILQLVGDLLWNMLFP